MLMTTNQVADLDLSASQPDRDGFIVLGMHRSGTSAVSGTLARLGATPPKTLMQENSGNQRGYWESTVLMDLHDKVLASCGSRWNDWRAISEDWYDTPVAAALKAEGKQVLAAEFGESPSFVLKDPRICRFARFWLEIFDEEKIRARLILPIRPPLEVAKSLHTLHGFTIIQGLLMWLRHVLDAERATRDRPRSFLRWTDFLDDWREVTHQIAVTQNITWPALSDLTAAEVDLFLSHSLKHEHADAAESLSHPSMHPWVLAAHEAMLKLVIDPQDPQALTALDDIRSAFDRAAEAFGPIIGMTEAQLTAVHQLLASERNVNAEYAAHHQHIENVRAADTERLIAEREAALNAQLAAVSAEREAAFNAQMAATSAAHAAALAGLEQQRLALEARLAETAEAINAHGIREQALEQQLHSALANLAASGAEAARLAALLEEQRSGAELALARLQEEHQQKLDSMALQQSSLMDTLANQEQLLESLRTAVETSDAQERAGQGVRAEQERQIEALASERTALAAQLAETEAASAAALASLRSDVEARLEAASERQLREADAHDRDIAAVSATLDAVLKSRSWSMTRPARAVLGWFK